ncbi:MAG: glycosyltransferase family 39 protein [Pseudolabrys sp.]|nr:glycosyltransferase family 39 protein [Pseudolabrys sp.]
MHKSVHVNSSFKTVGRGLLILLGILLLVRVGAMAVVPLMDTTEARYGEIGRKMAELNDWVTPWFNYGVPYWGKPPFSFWLTAASFDLFGVSAFTARLPHFITSLAIIGLVAWMVRRRDQDAVWPTIVCMSSATVFFISAGTVLTDMELTLGTTLAMLGFWIALEAPQAAGTDHGVGTQSRWFAGPFFFGGLVIGLLAKGPVALVLVGLPLFLWTACNARWRDVWRQLPWIGGLLLTLLISLPWYLIAEQHTAGFLHYFLVGEHFHRFITPGWHGDLYGNAHPSPFGEIWLFAIVGFLPWSVLIPAAAWRWRQPGAKLGAMFMSSARAVAATLSRRAAGGDFDDKYWTSYLLMWGLAPLLLFTAARNVGWTYVLSGLPAAAIFAGQWLTVQSRRGRNITPMLCGGLLLMLGLMFVVAVTWHQTGAVDKKSAKKLVAVYEQSMAQDATDAGSSPLRKDAAHAKVPLIFVVWRRPFSAEFYTRGKVIEVSNLKEAWLRIGDSAAYVAIYNGDDVVASAAAGAGQRAIASRAGDHDVVPIVKRAVRRFGRYGNFDLLFVAAR